MFRTIFQKQLSLYLGTLLLSLVFLGAVLSQVISVYFTNRRIEDLTQTGQKMAQSMSSIMSGLSYGIINRGEMQQFQNQASILSQYMNAELIFVDSDLNAVLPEPHSEDSVISLDIKEIAPLKNGERIVARGNLNEIYQETMLIVGVPVIINDGMVFGILMSSSISELHSAIWDMYKATGICILVSGLLGFILIYFSSNATIKPLKMMNDGARIIAAGDFEKRIYVKSKDEIGQLAESFNNMAESLNLQEKKRREFIANISHDLRSPLTSMRGFIQAVCDGTIPPENQNHYLGIVLDETDRLTKLTNDIMDLSRIQAGQASLNKSVFNANDLIRQTVMHFERRVKAGGINVRLRFTGGNAMVLADEEKIQRVLYNLLDNAVKFAPGGTVSVETGEGFPANGSGARRMAGAVVLSDAGEESGKLAVCVADDGKGISEEDQKNIFERFFKADVSRGEDKLGGGLGLSIVREFVRMHNESLYLESSPGIGSRFIFTLKLYEGDGVL